MVKVLDELLNAHLVIIDRGRHFKGYDKYCNMLYTIFKSVFGDLIEVYVLNRVFPRRNVPWFNPGLRSLVCTQQGKSNKSRVK